VRGSFLKIVDEPIGIIAWAGGIDVGYALIVHTIKRVGNKPVVQ